VLLKAVLQWMAASEGNMSVRYFPFNEPIGPELQVPHSSAVCGYVGWEQAVLLSRLFLSCFALSSISLRREDARRRAVCAHARMQAGGLPL
jgi:hypothetical protein